MIKIIIPELVIIIYFINTDKLGRAWSLGTACELLFGGLPIGGTRAQRQLLGGEKSSSFNIILSLVCYDVVETWVLCGARSWAKRNRKMAAMNLDQVGEKMRMTEAISQN